MRLSDISVLVVDDNKSMRDIVRVMLHGFGIKQVHLAGDGADALETLGHTDIDVVICDLAMTPIDGYEFLRFLRWSSDSPAPRVPVVILSGETEKQNIISARDGGAHEFVAKPVSAKILRQRIELVLRQPRDFVKTKDFNGPDRRRQKEFLGGVEKRLNLAKDAVEVD